VLKALIDAQAAQIADLQTQIATRAQQFVVCRKIGKNIFKKLISPP